MNSPSDERIRKAMQRLRAADGRNAPTFEQVVRRTSRQRALRPWRPQIAWASCAVVIVLVASVWGYFQLRDSTVEPVARSTGTNSGSGDSTQQGSLDREVDFDRWRKLIAESRFESNSTSWPTSTDSLLVLDLKGPSFQE